uniref:Secreted protein n=1 Tax=Romanomermis culicivorax TaxID=13658 RepID=A0A915JST8_ROMCU
MHNFRVAGIASNAASGLAGWIGVQATVNWLLCCSANAKRKAVDIRSKVTILLAGVIRCKHTKKLTGSRGHSVAKKMRVTLPVYAYKSRFPRNA